MSTPRYRARRAAVSPRATPASVIARVARLPRPIRVTLITIIAAAVVAGISLTAVSANAAPGCASNPIVCENALPGSPASDWDIDGAGDQTIQGFATQMSVNHGDPVSFKIDTDASAYTIQIFRLGYYQGLGARKIADVTPSATLPQTQPACATDATTEIFDCGTWGVSATWNVPTDAVSGVYLALLTRTDTGGKSQIPFIVRDDSSHADVVFQTSDATWQAYNTYGGSDFYTGLANGRAYKISYNRPINTRGNDSGRDYLFANEYPMLRFMEQNGYDMSYISSLDTDQRGSDLLNHKLFVSTGHDEYWSGGQRANVEKARDAGVNLAFFSGNEVYWKTRWEPSEDGTNTANRTLVCYKDTWSAAGPLDPNGPTSTWRDARGAAYPENALTGTIYKSNNTDLPITVSGAEGKLRLWRNTTLGQQADTATTALAPHTVGYESDEDLDNGFRPAGTFDLSTTTGPTPQYLTDFGLTVVPGTTTHHLTMYRAASGALVFGGGTVQWAWGIDTHHDGVVAPVSVAMQQATVNLFADMSVQPLTLSTPGVVAATQSTDTTAPTAIITSPLVTASIGQGSKVTVSGTATDAGGGVVAGVEVSLDGGTTWHPATGRSSFTYTGIVSGVGASVIRARAVDDSGNLQTDVATLATPSVCPCTLFGQTVPGTAAANDGAAYTLGVRFTSATNGFVSAIRFYKGAGNTGTHVGTLYGADGSTLASVTFSNESDSGWQTATFAAAVPVTAGTTYTAAYTDPNGHYAYDSQYFGYGGVTAGPLSAPGGPSTGSGSSANGVYANGNAFPNSSVNHANYWVDVVWNTTDPTPLTTMTTSPVDGATSVPVGSTVTAVLTRDPVLSSVSTSVTNASGQTVAGTTTYDQPTRKVTFTSSAPLAAGTTYTASVTASPLASGIAVKASSWSFTTAKPGQTAGTCPCSLFDDSDVPAVTTTNDTAGVEVGTAFSSDTAGQITGVRFYKGVGNTGSHTVSLWTASGTQLATAKVTNESTTGWQSATFDSPVTIAANTTYLVSYRAPNGGYSLTAGGLSAPTDRVPLHTATNAGRYSYDGKAPLNASGTSYWVDPIFTVPASATPKVSAVSPADNTTSTPVSTPVKVTFDGAIQPSSAAIVLKSSKGVTVAGSQANALGTVATFTPSAPLAAGETYTVTVSGARNLGGAAMASSSTTSFTTSGTSVCPCTLLSSSATAAVSDSGDAGAITVGTRFTSSSNGYILSLRYWRDAANTGTHTGALYDANGTKLASVTFADSGTGWQSATLSTPVAVTAGTSYVAAVFMPNGHYAVAANFFASPVVNTPLTGQQGLFTSGADAFPTSTYGNNFYYVDASFALTSDVTAPVLSTIKATGASGSATITWKSDEAASSVVTYGTSATNLTQTATGNPATTDHSVALTGLTTGTTYYYKVTSADASGNKTTSDVSSFTVVDKTGPVVSTVVVASSGPGTTITWKTDEASSTSVAYGTSATSLSQTATGKDGVTDHSATLSGLTVGTTYYYRVTSVDAAGNSTTSPATSAAAASWTQSPITTIKTLNDTDASISYVGSWYRSPSRGLGDYNDDATATTANGAYATVTFTGTGVALITEKNSDQGLVNVSLDGGAAKSVDTSSTTRQLQQAVYTVTGLANGSHTLRITKVSGTYALVDAVKITQVDTKAPVVSAVAATSPTTTTGTVTWKTDEASSTTVAYGTSATNLSQTATGDASTLNHSVSLSGLTAATTYYYRVTSIDASGNATTSPTTSSAAASFATGSGVRTINDSDSSISYSGQWKRSTNRGYGDNNDDVTYTNTNGSSASLTFTGTGIALLTEKYSDQGTISVSVDGGTAQTIDTTSTARQVQQAVFTATGLNNGTHTIKVTKVSGTNMLIDAFKVTQP